MPRVVNITPTTRRRLGFRFAKCWLFGAGWAVIIPPFASRCATQIIGISQQGPQGLRRVVQLALGALEADVRGGQRVGVDGVFHVPQFGGGKR